MLTTWCFDQSSVCVSCIIKNIALTNAIQSIFHGVSQQNHLGLKGLITSILISTCPYLSHYGIGTLTTTLRCRPTIVFGKSRTFWYLMSTSPYQCLYYLCRMIKFLGCVHVCFNWRAQLWKYISLKSSIKWVLEQYKLMYVHRIDGTNFSPFAFDDLSLAIFISRDGTRLILCVLLHSSSLLGLSGLMLSRFLPRINSTLRIHLLTHKTRSHSLKAPTPLPSSTTFGSSVAV